jgi:ABC-type branched-subunit amino acid transport system ATPase component
MKGIHGDSDQPSIEADSFGSIAYTPRTSSEVVQGVMIHSVTLSGYRAFEQFEMVDLGRINLLVGKNNTGKSSILEALFLLASGNNPSGLWYVLARRGEQTLPEPASNRGVQAEADVSHLFYGHEIGVGSELSISTTNDKPGKSVKYRIDMAKPEESPQLFAHLADEGLSGARLALWGSGTPDFKMLPLPLSRVGSLRVDTLQQYINLRIPKGDVGAAQFVTTESLGVGQILQLWSAIVLTPDEDRVIKGLKILEPKIERIAQVQMGLIQYPGQGFVYPSRGGFFVRLSGDEKRVPIGSFGDGIWRMLSIIVAIVRAKDNLLLIDEIDTGLHYSVMADMWRLLNEAAEIFNVQVFATTHSFDCVHSLASICRDVTDAHSEITIHRIESGRKNSVRFTEAQIKVAAERKLEIR